MSHSVFFETTGETEERQERNRRETGKKGETEGHKMKKLRVGIVGNKQE
jgi:hypothetical protein